MSVSTDWAWHEEQEKKIVPFYKQYFKEIGKPPDILMRCQQWNRVLYTNEGPIVKCKEIFGKFYSDNMILELRSNFSFFHEDKEVKGWLFTSLAEMLVYTFVLHDRVEIHSYRLQGIKAWWETTGNMGLHHFHTQKGNNGFTTTSVIVPQAEIEIYRWFPIMVIKDIEADVKIR
jgi:hypothetical protein